jgi:hypothetical protein
MHGGLEPTRARRLLHLETAIIGVSREPADEGLVQVAVIEAHS